MTTQLSVTQAPRYTSSDVAAQLNPGVEGFGWTSSVKDPIGKIVAWSDCPTRTQAIEMATAIANALNAYFHPSQTPLGGNIS